MKEGEAYRRLSHRKLILPLLVGGTISAVIMLLRGISSADIMGVMRILSDSFFVSSVLLLGFGGLKQMKKLGVFDMLIYSFSLLGWTLGFGRRYSSYEEFTSRSRGGAAFNLILSGLILLSLSLIFLLMYYLV